MFSHVLVSFSHIPYHLYYIEITHPAAQATYDFAMRFALFVLSDSSGNLSPRQDNDVIGGDAQLFLLTSLELCSLKFTASGQHKSQIKKMFSRFRKKKNLKTAFQCLKSTILDSETFFFFLLI